MTNLTGRQQEFLKGFLDLYQEDRQPMHYSQVAEHLGVSSITAYDMLKLLEKRGMVQTEYVVPEREQGPGRSTIVFSPTPEAQAFFSNQAVDDWAAAEWAQVRQRILDSLHTDGSPDYQALLAELVKRIPRHRNPMLFAAEMVAAILLVLHEVAGGGALGPAEVLRVLGLPGEFGLNALVGLALGLSFVEQANERLIRLLLSYAGRYQDVLSQLSGTNLHRLSDLAEEIVRQIERQAGSEAEP